MFSPVLAEPSKNKHSFSCAYLAASTRGTYLSP
jgi:hypothetical protein